MLLEPLIFELQKVVIATIVKLMYIGDLLIIPIIIVLVSCAASPKVIPAAEPTLVSTLPTISFNPPFEEAPKPPSVPTIPQAPVYILGVGISSQEQLSAFLQGYNKLLEKNFTDEFALLYIEEAAFEDVNHDVAFAQMCLETGFLTFGNLVTPDMNNFCGLGAIDEEHRGESFPDIRSGIRAQIQHLKGYATSASINNDLVDPRYKYISKGRSPTIAGLSGTWAQDPEYADKIINIIERLYAFAFGKEHG